MASRMAKFSRSLPLICTLFGLLLVFFCLSLAFFPAFETTTSATTPPSSTAESPVVLTNYGPVRGKTVQISTEDETIDMFLGIPFARPPVGKLRFEKPLPPDNWTLREASNFESSCLPLLIPKQSAKFLYWTEKYDEDCLYLNIFSPTLSGKEGKSDQTKLPVLVLIHGGIYLMGSAFMYPNYVDIGQKYVNQGIIVVTLQYRLGVFGFASTGDSNMPGNLGLWDLTAAIKFVSENIEAFGGDSQRVTLFGYSAGSGLVDALSLLPDSAGYFSQAAQFSSSILSGRGTGAHVVQSTKELAASVNCQVSDTLQMKECLKGLTTDKLLEAIKQQVLTTNSQKQFGVPTFGPRVDNEFFQGSDYTELMRIHAKNSKPTMIGLNNLEALLLTLLPNENSSYMSVAVPWEHFNTFDYEDVRAFVHDHLSKAEGVSDIIKEELEEKILDFYLGDKSPANNATYYLEKYVLLVSDLLYTVPILWEARIKAAKNWTLYLYVITYTSDDFPKEVPVRGSYHTRDKDYLFEPPSQTKELSKSDRIIQEQLVNSLRNFVKNRDPSFGSVKWPSTDAKTFKRLRFDLPQAVVEESTEDFRRVEFWDGLLSTKYNPVRDIIVQGNAKNEL